MAEDDQERNEEATERKRSEMRKKGKVFRSVEASSTVVYISILVLLFFYAGSMVKSIVLFDRKIFSMANSYDLNIATAGALFGDIGKDIGFIVFPIFLTGVVVAIGINLAQVGFLFTTEPFEFDLGKMNPVEGLKKLLSMKTMFELLKTLVKLGFVGYLAFTWIRDEIPTLLILSDLSPAETMNFLGTLLWRLSIPVSILMVVVSAFDFAYQKYDYEQSIKMSKQDIKEETKQQEGDPKYKGKIKALQREMSLNRMMHAVPSSTVVVTNPTHLAVAMKYEQNQEGAPVVVAKGAGFVAQRIKEIARENGVIIVENKPLARSLFKSVEINQQVPELLYKATAEVLAYVFKLKNMKRKSR